MWILFIASALAWSNQETVIWHNADVSTLDYSALLKADGEALSPVNAHRRLFPKSADRESLLRRFAEAQQKFLSPDRRSAAESFKKVVELWLTQDWGPSDRKLIALSILRLAQLELNENQRDEWLTKASLVGTVDIDRSMFPPPLLARWDRLRGQISWIKDIALNLREGWDLILLNGNPCSSESCAPWPLTKEKVRVTFLSNRWQSETTLLQIEDLHRFRPQRKAWDKTICETHFGRPCDRRSLRLTQILKQEPAVVPAQPKIDWPEDSIKKSAKVEKKWLWIGLGALTAAVLIQQAQDKKNQKEPTTTYGY